MIHASIVVLSKTFIMYKIAFIAFAALLFSSCNQQEKALDSEAHQHNQGELSVTHTLFSSGLEFHIEHQALEKGTEHHILAHLTRLDSYSPCTSGELSFSIGDFKSVSPEPIAPGIWELEFMPAEAGHFHGLFTFRGEDIEQSVEAHLDVHAGHEEVHHEDEGGQHSHSDMETGEIIFTKEQAWEGRFFVEECRSGPFHTVIPTSGELMPMPGEKKNIVSTSRGMVRFADPQLVQGKHLEKDLVLFNISSESMVEDNLKLRLEAARNRLELSRSEYLRHRKLFENGVVSEKQFLGSRSSYVEDSLDYFNLEAHVSSNGIRIVAPASGSLHELAVSDGMYVSEGDLLAVLSPDRNLLLRVDLPQQYYELRQSVTGANFRTAYSDRVFSQEELGGQLLSVGHSVKENDHYLPVNFLLENKGNLLEGAFVEVFLIAGEKENALTIPLSALGEEQGGHYVYVQVSGESYSKHRVHCGQSDGLRIEITDGLQAGERIVSRGNMLLKAASMNTDAPGQGHSH